VEKIGEDLIYQGDIMIQVATSTGGRGGAAITDTDGLWPDSKIPYIIATGHPKSAEILLGIDDLNKKTNVCVTPRNSETDYVEFQYEAGKCGSSYIGKIGGKQVIKIGNQCANTRGSATHETMHALGFYHEQSRDDRDDFVTINTENITLGNSHNFDKYNESIWHFFFPEGQNIGSYNYNSIMHYGKFAFGKTDSSGNTLQTITPVSSTAQIGQRDSLTVGDIKSINRLYPTKCTNPVETIETSLTDSASATQGNNPAINISHSVELVPQQTNMSCWAAAAAMVVGWRDFVCINPSEIARGIGYWSQYNNNGTGLPPDDTRMFAYWGLTLIQSPQTYTVNGFADLLRGGPLWVATDLNGGGHVVVDAGLRGDGTPDGTMVKVYDPWEQGMTTFRTSNKGSIYEQTYTEFVHRQELLSRKELSLPAAFYVAY
jgi:hypothetical protein